jgi:hypothetical protein
MFFLKVKLQLKSRLMTQFIYLPENFSLFRYHKTVIFLRNVYFVEWLSLHQTGLSALMHC